MQQIYTCTFEPHKKEPIIGLCLNPSCQESPQFCSKCMLEKHQNHINDCKRFRDLSAQIQQLINENVRPAKVFFEIMKIMTDQFKKTTQMIQNKLHRDLQIQQILIDQQHSVLKENLDYFRTICSVELQDQKKLVTQLCQELKVFIIVKINRKFLKLV